MPTARGKRRIALVLRRREAVVDAAAQTLTAQEGRKNNKKCTGFCSKVFTRATSKALSSLTPATTCMSPTASRLHLPFYHLVRRGKPARCSTVAEQLTMTRNNTSYTLRFDAMPPPLGCHTKLSYPTQEMVSCSFSLSKDSSTDSPRQIPQTSQIVHATACGETFSLEPRLSVRDAPVLLSCPCEEVKGSRLNTKDSLLAACHFYGGESQNRGDGSASIPTRQPQLLRHPPENWSEEISQNIYSHQEETSNWKSLHKGFDGTLVGAQKFENFAREQSSSRLSHQGVPTGDKEKMEESCEASDRRAVAGTAVKKAVVTSLELQAQGLADTESCTSNLLRSLSAEVTKKKVAAESLSKFDCQENQLGVAGIQKLRSRHFWSAARIVCKSPSARRKPPQLAEKGRHLHRTMSSVKEVQRKGQHQKEEPQEALLTDAAPSLDARSLPPGKILLNPYQAQWRVRTGQSPSAFSCSRPEHTITRPASSHIFAAADPLRRARPHSSETHLVQNLESRPHILVRSYKTFHQECAGPCNPEKLGEIAETKSGGSGLPKFVQEPDQAILHKSCIGNRLKFSSRGGHQCTESSRKVQKEPFYHGSISSSIPPVSNTQLSNGKSRSRAANCMIPNRGSSSEGVQAAGSWEKRTASGVSRRCLRETGEGFNEGIHAVVPQRLFLKRLLGSGAMGHVYLVELDGRPYALKIALQSDPAACMYLRQGWRNLVHLEKIHQQRQKEVAKQTNRLITKSSYSTGTDEKNVLRCTSPRSAHQGTAQVTGRQYELTGRTTAPEGTPDLQQPNANDEGNDLHPVERGLPGKRRESVWKEPEIRMPEGNFLKTIQVDCEGTQYSSAHDLMIHSLNGDVGDTSRQEGREVTAEEKVNTSFRRFAYKENSPPLPSPASAETSSVRRVDGACRKSGKLYLDEAFLSSGRPPNSSKCVLPEKRDRYFCRPVAFIEGEWFRFEALEQDTTVAPKPANMPVLHLQTTSTEQKQSCELLAQHATAGDGAAVYTASHSSLNSPPLRKHRQGCHAAEKQAVACVPPRVPVCAYIMEYIPDACQLTAVIWNLHRCLDPSHALRRDCINSVLGQRLVEIGLCVAEAHKYIAAEAGLYSFDFNPKNILVCVLPRGKRESSPFNAAFSTKNLTLPSASSASPLSAGRGSRAGTRVRTRQNEEATAPCKALPFRCVPLSSKQQLQHQPKGQRQQQRIKLHMHQQHSQQQQTDQQCHRNLSSADITRMVLCDPQVQFRVVAIDLDCSLQAPFSPSAGPSRAADVIGSRSFVSPSLTENALGPLLDWSCGRRVVYSCPHVSSITAAYIVAVLAKNKGEGQFTRSGLCEAAAHAALCCRIDSKNNFLHYLWAPPEMDTSRNSRGDEQAKTPMEEQQCVFTETGTKILSPLSGGAARMAVQTQYSSKQVYGEVDDKQLDGSSCRTPAKGKLAAQQGGQGPIHRNNRYPFLHSSCIPAEISTSAHASAQKRPAPAATEPRCSSLLRVYSSCTSPTIRKFSSTSRASPFRGDSCPKVTPGSNAQPTARGSNNRTKKHTICLNPQIPPLSDHGKHSCGGQLSGTVREMVDSNPGETFSTDDCSSTTGGLNADNSGPCSKAAHKHATVSQRAERGEKKPIGFIDDHSKTCGCAYRLHASSSIPSKPLEVSTSRLRAFLRQQPHLPCFFYPRWSPKSPREICQREYSNYGVRLVGQHVNLQLLSFILCELLDFRSLHVVVLQRFGMELRALHLPTGICQMFSEQDQIISCLCFSALTRMTSAVVPPLRFLSPAPGNCLPMSSLHLALAESSSLSQRRSIVSLPLDGKTVVAVCWCQDISESKTFGSLQPKEANETDEKESDRLDAVATNKIRQPVLGKDERCCVAGTRSRETLLKDVPFSCSAGNGPTVLLLQKQDTDGAILLQPCAAAEGRACISMLKGCAEKIEGQIVSTATGANCVSSRSHDATTWRICMGPQGQHEPLKCGKGERQRHKYNQEDSHRRAAGKNKAGTEEDGSTQAPRCDPDTQKCTHIESIPLCVRCCRNDRLSQREHSSQSPRLLSPAGCHTAPITACQQIVGRKPATAGTARRLGTREASSTVAPVLVKQLSSCTSHKEQQRALVESSGCVPGAVGTPEACFLSLGCTQQLQEKWVNTAVKTHWQHELNLLKEGSPFGAYAGSQRPDEVVHSNAADVQAAAELYVGARYKAGPACPTSIMMLRQQQELQQEKAQQEQQQKVRRLMPEDISRMSVWDRVEQLPALNPHDFLPPLHLFGTFCTQEVAALNAVLVQFLDPHPFFALQYSSSDSAFDSIIHALRRLQRRLASLREDACI